MLLPMKIPADHVPCVVAEYQCRGLHTHGGPWPDPECDQADAGGQQGQRHGVEIGLGILEN